MERRATELAAVFLCLQSLSIHSTHSNILTNILIMSDSPTSSAQPNVDIRQNQ